MKQTAAIIGGGVIGGGPASKNEFDCVSTRRKRHRGRFDGQMAGRECGQGGQRRSTAWRNPGSRTPSCQSKIRTMADLRPTAEYDWQQSTHGKNFKIQSVTVSSRIKARGAFGQGMRNTRSRPSRRLNSCPILQCRCRDRTTRSKGGPHANAQRTSAVSRTIF